MMRIPTTMKTLRLRVLLLSLAIAASLPVLADDGDPPAGHAGHEGHHGGAMHGAMGAYPMSREASGTSWQPDATPMEGLHQMWGDWMLMVHGFIDVVYDDQGGPRGDDKAFVPSMLMAMGQRPLGAGTWGLRSMVSLDPTMGKRGYPLLLQTGETADGVEPLIDRQHPHDLFMELATTYSVPVSENASVFGYVGLPGEPAIGPPAFMHRGSGMALPEAPLSHHWLDSTHIVFGVATLGAIVGNWKFETSHFNGREPDASRWNIETRALDSWSGRISWNPSAAWSAQVSHGYLRSPEQLEPEVGVHRSTASVSHVAKIGSGHWASTVAVGLNREEGRTFPAYLLESSREFGGPWTVFGRAEMLHNEHLVHDGELAHREFRVGKLSLGASYEFATWQALAFRVGALGSVYRIPGPLHDEYGRSPFSSMVFLRIAVK